MMFEKLIIRHLANSLLKTLPEELTSKISSLLRDLKKQIEMGKKASLIPRSCIGSFVLLLVVLCMITSPFQGTKSSLRTK